MADAWRLIIAIIVLAMVVLCLIKPLAWKLNLFGRQRTIPVRSSPMNIEVKNATLQQLFKQYKNDVIFYHFFFCFLLLARFRCNPFTYF